MNGAARLGEAQWLLLLTGIRRGGCRGAFFAACFPRRV